MGYNKLISNEYYSLSELFGTPDRKIIIPDFQRDYCWGDNTHGNLRHTDIVTGFLETLFEEYSNEKTSNLLLGKIDVYEHPKNHIYLTDGQQRLTTLYLLIGMLCKREKNVTLKARLRASLISDFELNHDDKEPYLQYAIRESTMFFLRDLVDNFFINENTLSVTEIQKQPWYFDEYKLDPSIISMISALTVMELKLKSIASELFSVFVLDRIKIQYYDVVDKNHGEERFVIINTTGKGLTQTENIKPILLGGNSKNQFAQEWEQRENFFWKYRIKGKENIADNGVNDFLTWCFQIIDKQDELDIIKKAKGLITNNKSADYLVKIDNYFNSLEKIIECLDDEGVYQQQFKFINDNVKVKGIIGLRELSKIKQQNIVLPLLSFVDKFGTEGAACYQFLRRLRKNYFDLIWKERNQNYVDWRYLLQIIEKSNSIEEILHYQTNEETINSIQNVKLNIWFNQEEKQKTLFFKNKERIENWEDHIDFMGDLSTLFDAYLVSENLPLDEEKDILKIEKIYSNYQQTIDLIRSGELAKENIVLANIFRLFRLYIECNKVEHIYRASWDFEGVLFSTLNRKHLNNSEFLKLLNADDLITFCTSYIKERVKKEEVFNLTEFNVKKFIKAWLTLKVFNANTNNVLLSFYDGNETGVAAYVKKNDNKLIDSEEFSLANSICGFGVRSGFGAGNYVHHTNRELWCNPCIIDSPFSDIAFTKDDRTNKQIGNNQKLIDEILMSINTQIVENYISC
jgi:uncharacterized protein with ParB-like and HNH nuclease domain